MEPDPLTAPVVALIFDMYAAGDSLGSIAATLVEQGHPSPSAHDRKRNRHRRGEGWAKSAVRAILLNRRYTGHEVYGKQPTTYELIDPENPAFGDEKVQRWADASKWVVSNEPVHAPLVSQDTFEAVQGRFQVPERTTRPKPRVSRYDYVLKGRIVCGACDRRMEGSRNNGKNHYRCRIRSDYVLPETSQHPRTLYLPEEALVSGIDTWIMTAFEPANLEATVAALVDAAENAGTDEVRESLQAEITDCEVLLRRYKAALAADDSVETVVSWIKEAEVRRARAQQELARRTSHARLDAESLHSLLAAIPSIRERLSDADATAKAGLYSALDLRLTFASSAREVHLTANLAVACGTRACPRLT